MIVTLHSVQMEGLYIIYSTHHIKGMMSQPYYICIYINVLICYLLFVIIISTQIWNLSTNNIVLHRELNENLQ